MSSENAGTGQLGIKAVDGIVEGFPGDYTKEWATLGELAGAWIKLSWSSAVSVSQVVLFDRPNLTDNILGGTLLFSDGSSVVVGKSATIGCLRMARGVGLPLVANSTKTNVTY